MNVIYARMDDVIYFKYNVHDLYLFLSFFLVEVIKHQTINTVIIQ